MSFTQLTPHLWVTQSKVYLTNSGIFLSADQSSMIDPGVLPDEIKTIAHLVAEQGAKVQSLVITHSHWDHILGPEHFPGVQIIAQANYTAETSGQPAQVIRREVARWEESVGIQREQPFIIPQPDRTFAEETTLELGALTLRLVHAPGHAADELVVYHPDSATLWAGDMLSDLEIPFVSHNLAAYERTLAMLSAWEIRVLVPGHGHATTDPAEIRTRLSEDSAYLGDVCEKVEQCIHQGKTIKEAVAACAGIRFRHPEENAVPHQLNVESAYAELGGPVDPMQVGWNRLSTEASAPGS